MIKKMKFLVPFVALVLVGCQSYTWTSSVPSEKRTISVPTFRNESHVTELGALVTQQVLRDFQREGTFRLAPADKAAVEVQGIIKSTRSVVSGYTLRSDRLHEYSYSMVARVSLIDKQSGRVIFDNRDYTARTTFLSGHDMMTKQRDASGRLAEDLARQIVDDVLSAQW